MKFRSLIAMSWAIWCLVITAGAGQAPSNPGAAPGATDAQSTDTKELQAALADQGQLATIEALWRQTVLDHGSCDALQQSLNQRLQETADADHGIALRWVQSQLYQRQGLLDQALQVLDGMPETAQDARFWLSKGRLLDALGRMDPAREAYGAALPLLSEDHPERLPVRLRLALLAMQEDSEAKDALLEFARKEELSLEERNRAAVVLALLDRPKDGIELFETYGEGSALFRQQIRLSEWALKAKDFEHAQQYAWQARESAVTNRDRYYALALLRQAYRDADQLEDLLDEFADLEINDKPTREAWISMLRELGRFEQAVQLFEEDAAAAQFPIQQRRELLEMYRDSGREQEMLEQYRKLIEEQPRNWIWPEGISRFYLENGDVAAAREAWQTFLQHEQPGANYLEGAKALMGVGMDDLALQCAEDCIAADKVTSPAYLFLYELHSFRGDLEQATVALDRMRDALAADAPERMQLAESYERLGDLEQAVSILEDLRSIRGPERTGEDLEMRLAWLHSEVGNEELALQRWQEIWLRIDSIPRRRYVEDRLMSVASRLGLLADIAIELEKKLYDGTANQRESGLLVRLYTKVGDAVSATEIIDEHLKHSGGSEVEALQEQARVFLACTDYHNYERTVNQLIELDAEGEPDYLRQIAMSMLERGKPQQARKILARLKELGATTDEAEFEAGVLALAGLNDDAITAYRRGIAGNANRIESYLLMANLMAGADRKQQAIGMFQHLAEHAQKDDLFTIAIDGLINMEAPAPVLRWARRITLERLARRHDKPYLYQLLADLAELSNDVEAQFTALENLLPIAGDRRTSVVRELMDLAAGSNSFMGPRRQPQTKRHLDFGRRLISLGQLVPPQVYLDLGRAFLNSQDVNDAVNTFSLARGLADFDAFQRDTAALFEQALYLEEAKQTYQKVLIGDNGNLGLLIKVAELQEQTGNDVVAAEAFQRALELLLSRRPAVAAKEEKDIDDPYARWMARNVDDFDRYYTRALDGLKATLLPEAATALLQRQREQFAIDLAQVHQIQSEREQPLPLDRFPRLLRRTNFVREVAMTYGLPAIAEAADLQLLQAFDQDQELLPRLMRSWSRNGLVGIARNMLNASPRPALEKDPLRFMIGEGLDPQGFELIPADEALRLVMPMLTDNRHDEAKILLQRVDYRRSESSTNTVGALFSAATMLDDPDLLLTLSRHWLRLQFKDPNSYGFYGLRGSLDRVMQVLPAEHFRSYCQYYMQLVLEDPDKNGAYIAGIPVLQEKLEQPLLTAEELTDLVAEQGNMLAYNLGPLLALTPVEERATLASSVWTELSPSMRNYFPFNLLMTTEVDLGGELEGLLLDWFKVALKDGDQRYTVQRGDGLLEQKLLERNYELVGQVLGLMDEQFPDNPLIKAYRSRWMWINEPSDEALNMAIEAYFDPAMNNDTDWSYRQAKRQIESEFFQSRPQAFLDRWEERNQKDGADLKLTKERLNMVRRLDRPELYLSELQSAMKWHKDELSFKLNYYNELRSRDRLQEAEEWMAKLLVDHKEDQSLWRSHFYQLRGAGRYVEALVALKQWQELIAAETAEQPTPEEVEEKIDTRAPRPGVWALKKELEEKGDVAAQPLLRRMWRTYPRDNQQMVYVYRQPLTQIWPLDREEVEEPEEITAKRRRGGLEAFLVTEVQPVQQEDPPTMWEVLAGYDFGVNEMQRLLRVEGASATEGKEQVIAALAHARAAKNGSEQAVQELLEMAVAGRALRHHYLQLLVLLSEQESSLSQEAQAVIDGLQRSLDPKDGPQLLELARVMAATGDRERAVSLYRWCATRVSTNSIYSFNEEDQSLTIRQLLTSAKQALQSGDDLIELIELALQVAAPSDNPWDTENYQRLVLETWTELLPAAEALERCAKICADADSRDHSLRRDIARRATLLYAQAGNLERALACAEVAFCSFPLDAFHEEYRYYYYGRSEHPAQGLYNRDWPNWLPAEATDFADASAWYQAFANAMLDWFAAERFHESTAITGSVLAVVRLWDMGQTEAAEQLLARLNEVTDLNGHHRLWIADAFRYCGQGSVAAAIEHQLLEERQLTPSRWNDVFQAVAAEQGPEAALAAYLPLCEKNQRASLMEALLELAESAGDQEQLTRLQQIHDQAQAAKAELDAWQEAEDEKRKKSQAASGAMPAMIIR